MRTIGLIGGMSWESSAEYYRIINQRVRDQLGPLRAYTHARLHATTFYVKADVSRDGSLLAAGSGDGVVCVFPTDEKYLDSSAYRGYVKDSGQGVKTGRGAALVRGHEKEVTGVSWTVEGDLVSISDDYHVRCWRNGEGGEAEGMREGGEEEGRRWAWGWAEVEGEAVERRKVGMGLPTLLEE